MFISVEKSIMQKVKVPERQVVDLLSLSAKLSEAENTHRAKFMLAFPSKEENETFDRNWKAVLNSETDRHVNLRDPGPFELDPFSAHQAYHDVESFFWVFLWTFVRAQPEGSESAENEEYITFCDIMLRHGIKTRGSDRRIEYLFSARRYLPHIFHPQLERFCQLFIDMAEYLSIPWRRYESLKLQDDHVHLAMLRLLLAAIFREDMEKCMPIQIAEKVRHFTSEFPAKRVRLNWQSKSASRSISFSETADLGSIPEVEDLHP